MKKRQQGLVSSRRRSRYIKQGVKESNNADNNYNEIDIEQNFEKFDKESCAGRVQQKLKHVYQEFEREFGDKDDQQNQIIKEDDAEESQEAGDHELVRNKNIDLNMMQQEEHQISNVLIGVGDSLDLEIDNRLNDIIEGPIKSQNQESISSIVKPQKKQQPNLEEINDENQDEQSQQSQYQVSQNQLQSLSQDDSSQSKPSKAINTELINQLQQLGQPHGHGRVCREPTPILQKTVISTSEQQIIIEVLDKQKQDRIKREDKERLEIQKLKQKWPEFNDIFRSYSHASIFSNNLSAIHTNNNIYIQHKPQQSHLNFQSQQKDQKKIKKNNKPARNKKNSQKVKNCGTSKPKKTSNKIKYFLKQFINRFYQNKDKTVSDLFKPDHLPESKHMGEAELKEFQKELNSIYNQVRMMMRQQIYKYQEKKNHNYSLQAVKGIFGSQCNNQCVKQDRIADNNGNNTRRNLFRTPTDNAYRRRCRSCLKSFLLRKTAHKLIFDEIIPSIFSNKQINKQREEYVYTLLIQAYRCKNPILMGRSTVI